MIRSISVIILTNCGCFFLVSTPFGSGKPDRGLPLVSEKKGPRFGRGEADIALCSALDHVFVCYCEVLEGS